ncbi:MAG: FAD-dependent oxidoreductase [Proteobacteria bacterium]|nr:FAD-dependent oxidoreductase [Pseudomonadota bacterium]
MSHLLGPLVQIDQTRCLSWTVGNAPCQAACPLGVQVEAYINAIENGEFDRAFEIILRDCPLPGVMARICYRPCEAACKRTKIDESLAIRELKRFASDHGRIDAAGLRQPGRNTGGKVAIIGSGPAGLTCAWFLALEGHEPTIFEALPVVGGMLRVGIPEYRLPREVLAADIRNITDLGVAVRTNTPIDDKHGVDDLLQSGFQAVFIATGAHQGRSLNIPGENMNGVVQGLGFLRDLNLGNTVPPGERVAVIGGGNVAFDAARSALRSGSDVTLVYRRSRGEMPATEEEIQAAELEGVRIEYQAAPTAIHGPGQVGVLQCARTRLGPPDASGRRQPAIDTDSRFDLPVDQVIVAVGQKPGPSFAGTMQGARKTEAETIHVDPATMTTGRKGVFAGGDAQSGASTALDAMAAGKKAAASIDRYLRGEDPAQRAGEGDRAVVTGFDRIPRNVIPRQSEKPFELQPAVRIRSFKEIGQGYTREQAVREAKRCLKCRTCNRCLEEFGCPAIVWRENDGKFSPHMDNDICIGCQVCIQVCPFSSIAPLEIGR